jgi:hypothetical protein
MAAIALRLAERLRFTSDKLKIYTPLVQAMQREIDHRMPTWPPRSFTWCNFLPPEGPLRLQPDKAGSLDPA